MEKKFTKKDQMNYEMQFIITPQEYTQAKDLILKEFQKDYEAPGFRKGFVPLDIVEKNIKPEYLQIGIYEKLLTT